MRKILALLALPLLLLLQACNTMAVQLGTAAPILGFSAAGTLATNPCEEATAAGYTQIKLAADKVKRKLGAGQSTPQQARQVLAVIDQALLALDSSCPGKSIDPLMLAIATERTVEVRKTMEAVYGH